MLHVQVTEVGDLAYEGARWSSESREKSPEVAAENALRQARMDGATGRLRARVYKYGGTEYGQEPLAEVFAQQ